MNEQNVNKVSHMNYKTYVGSHTQPSEYGDIISSKITSQTLETREQRHDGSLCGDYNYTPLVLTKIQVNPPFLYP